MLIRTDGRLSQQGRLLRTLVGLTALVAALMFGTQAFAEGAAEPVPTDTHTVAQGETLWSIAGTVRGPGESTSAVVREIMQINGMETSSLAAGDQILVPVAG